MERLFIEGEYILDIELINEIIDNNSIFHILKDIVFKNKSIIQYQAIINWAFINNLNHLPFKEILYHLLKKEENEGKCLICEKQTRFENFNLGYKKYCSAICSYKCIKRINNIKKTNEEKYGNTNPFSFGSDNFKKLIKNKYDVDNISQLEEIKIKKEETSLISNGYRYHTQSMERRKILSENIKRPEHQAAILKSQNHISKLEMEFGDYIKSIYNKNIIESDRTILGGKELDLYLPDIKIAFEFNGRYWHSEKFVGKDYHKNKTYKCK